MHDYFLKTSKYWQNTAQTMIHSLWRRRVILASLAPTRWKVMKIVNNKYSTWFLSKNNKNWWYTGQIPKNPIRPALSIRAKWPNIWTNGPKIVQNIFLTVFTLNYRKKSRNVDQISFWTFWHDFWLKRAFHFCFSHGYDIINGPKGHFFHAKWFSIQMLIFHKSFSAS